LIRHESDRTDTEPLSKEEKEAIKEVLDEEDDIGKYD